MAVVVQRADQREGRKGSNSNLQNGQTYTQKCELDSLNTQNHQTTFRTAMEAEDSKCDPGVPDAKIFVRERALTYDLCQITATPVDSIVPFNGLSLKLLQPWMKLHLERRVGGNTTARCTRL